MEKYIFLDFDGVLNTPKGKFDQKAIGTLRCLLERCDAKVIISSTWRLQGVEHIRQLWKEYLLPGEVTDLTPSCNSITFCSADGTKEWQCLHEAKGLEIAEWLRLNAKELSLFERWLYGALKYIALYIFMVILFMTFVYWYPGKKVMNTNRHFLMIQNSLHQYHFPWQK